MRKLIAGMIGLAGLCVLAYEPGAAQEFPTPEYALRDAKAIRYESVYTRIPSTGKLATIKITDSGRIYYVCREKSGYAIYHVEFRPAERFKAQMEKELRDLAAKWDRVKPDELLFTKETYEQERLKCIQRYSEAVWVRNEIVMSKPAKSSEEQQ
ncbi:MAG: hypothetical protein FJ118_00095 [Deltaproteobacteria bacterium]|nr:hypothetical protein [Deltaproteobacteria bacterium]